MDKSTMVRGFTKEDKKYWQLINEAIEHNPRSRQGLIIKYDCKEVLDFYLPSRLFWWLLKDHNIHKNHLPFKVTVKKLDKKDNAWLKKSNMVGVLVEDILHLHVNPSCKFDVVNTIWLLLHEHRHLIQEKENVIKSCVTNPSWKLFEEKMSLYSDKDTVNHVLHEIAPYENDANVFACQILGVPYPGSGFSMTEERFNLLNINRAK